LIDKFENNALKCAWEVFDEQKVQSYINDKNTAIISNIHKLSGVSRNNFSQSYMETYPKWKELREAVDAFKIEFEEKNRTPENSKIKKLQKELKETKKLLRNSLSEKLELIRDLSKNKDEINIDSKKLADTIENNHKLEAYIARYIEKYGLLD